MRFIANLFILAAVVINMIALARAEDAVTAIQHSTFVIVLVFAWIEARKEAA